MRIVQSILWVLLSLAIGYFVLLIFMYVLQSQMVYHPQKKLEYTPQDIGLLFEDVRFSTEDDLELHGWYIPASNADATVLYFHGNAGNISGRLQTIRLLHDLGLNVFIFDYRGYGGSEGSPSEAGTYKDALAAWDHLTSERGLPSSNIVIMGRSLGGSVAAWIAAQKKPAAVIIESTFTSAPNLGAELYSWLPVRHILKYEYNTLENVKQIEVPFFIAHSVDDEIVPYHHGKELFKAANDPKKFVELRGSHGSGFLDTGDRYRQALHEFLTDHI